MTGMRLTHLFVVDCISLFQVETFILILLEKKFDILYMMWTQIHVEV